MKLFTFCGDNLSACSEILQWVFLLYTEATSNPYIEEKKIGKYAEKIDFKLFACALSHF